MCHDKSNNNDNDYHLFIQPYLCLRHNSSFGGQAVIGTQGLRMPAPSLSFVYTFYIVHFNNPVRQVLLSLLLYEEMKPQRSYLYCPGSHHLLGQESEFNPRTVSIQVEHQNYAHLVPVLQNFLLCRQEWVSTVGPYQAQSLGKLSPRSGKLIGIG